MTGAGQASGAHDSAIWAIILCSYVGSLLCPRMCPCIHDSVYLQELYCAVELHGSLTRGMSTFDWNKTLERAPNVSLVKRVNLEGFNAMMDASTD